MFCRATILGRMVANPELRMTQNEVKVCSFRIAVDRPYKVDDKRKADFFDVVAWRGTAEFVAQYFSKGRIILVDGHLETRSYEDKNGITRYITELIAERVSFAGENKGKSERPLPDPPPEYGANSDFSECASDSDDLPF